MAEDLNSWSGPSPHAWYHDAIASGVPSEDCILYQVWKSQGSSGR